MALGSISASPGEAVILSTGTPIPAQWTCRRRCRYRGYEAVAVDVGIVEIIRNVLGRLVVGDQEPQQAEQLALGDEDRRERRRRLVGVGYLDDGIPAITRWKALYRPLPTACPVARGIDVSGLKLTGSARAFQRYAAHA